MALLDHHAQSRKPIPWAAAGMVCLALATVLSVPAQSNSQPSPSPTFVILSYAQNLPIFPEHPCSWDMPFVPERCLSSLRSTFVPEIGRGFSPGI